MEQDFFEAHATPTYNAIFKYILSHETICKSILQSFIPHHRIYSVSFVDTQLNPIKFNQTVRNIINSDTFNSVVDQILSLSDLGGTFSITSRSSDNTETIPNAQDFLVQFAKTYKNLISCLPSAESEVDMMCTVDNGQYVLVKLQVISKEFCDKKALYYACQTYVNQLSKGSTWDQIKKVICINLLGGAKANTYWTIDQNISHFCLKNQDNNTAKIGIEIIQYPLNSYKVDKKELYKQQGMSDLFLKWLEFFEFIQQPKDEIPQEVKEAYDLITISKLPKHVKEAYLKEIAKEFSFCSQNTQILIEEAKEEGRKQGREEARKEELKRNMLQVYINLRQTGMTKEEALKVVQLQDEDVADLQLE